MNHLVGVTMTRPESTQTRSFAYTGPDLTSATNPENGTVHYTYNAAHQVATRTDAKNQVTQYTYDGYGRVTAVSGVGLDTATPTTLPSIPTSAPPTRPAAWRR